MRRRTKRFVSAVPLLAIATMLDLGCGSQSTAEDDAGALRDAEIDVQGPATGQAKSAPLVPVTKPGICSNDNMVACAANADCGAGNTCYIPTSGGQTLSNQVCMQDAYGAALQCTANDVNVARTTSLQVLDGCDYPGDTATISFVAEFDLTAQDRYDIGVWVAQDGGNALTGTCSVSDFPTAPTPPWVNLDSASQPTDTCGDIDADHNPLYSSIQHITVQCIDKNGDGNLDIDTCLSWQEKGANGTCTSPIQALPGAPSKCSCEQLPGIAIPVPGKIIVRKVTDPSSDTTTQFPFALTGGPTPVNASFTLAGGGTWNSQSDGSLVLPPSSTLAYVVTETTPSNWSLTSATCVSDQTGRTPTPGNIVLHSGETVTCTFNNHLTDRCAGITCQADTACATYACDAADGVCKAHPKAAGTQCRASAGSCDVAESCDGTSTECPADGFAASTTVCRASTGVCDPEETCTGTSAQCPADVLSPATTVCRASAGACDVAETCTGTSGACPADGFATGTVCRPSAGDCDVAETCSGSSASCPADGFAPSSTVCRPSAGICDKAELCTGSTSTCPADVFDVGTVCRASAGDCDLPEVCNGSGASCPADVLLVGTVCRPSAGACDVAETCNGVNPSCPVDAFQPSTTECRPSAGACDVAESCTGTDALCPQDSVKPSGTECRAKAGDCDVAEACDGTSTACPADGFQPSTTVCRASAGACDVAENCTGTTALCPADALQNQGTVCRASAGVCDVAEVCSGTDVNCPTDGYSSQGTVCRPAGTNADCEPAEVCSGDSASCPADTGNICNFRNQPQITPTGTTCQQYLSNTSPSLSSLVFNTRGGLIRSVSPGVFFVYDGVHVNPSGSVTVTEASSNWLRAIGVLNNEVLLYDLSCTVQHIGTLTVDADGNVSISGVPAGDYVLSVKYDPRSLVGYEYPTNSNTYTYTVRENNVLSGSASILVTRK